MDLGIPLEFPQESQVLSRVETCKSAFLSSCKSSVRLPIKLTWESVAFFLGATGLSLVPSCCELILRVTVESVQGNQVYLEWNLDIRVFLNCGTTPGVPLEFQVETAFS